MHVYNTLQDLVKMFILKVIVNQHKMGKLDERKKGYKSEN